MQKNLHTMNDRWGPKHQKIKYEIFTLTEERSDELEYPKISSICILIINLWLNGESFK
jgi:hypothetical protein